MATANVAGNVTDSSLLLEGYGDEKEERFQEVRRKCPVSTSILLLVLLLVINLILLLGLGTSWPDNDTGSGPARHYCTHFHVFLYWSRPLISFVSRSRLYCAIAILTSVGWPA